MLRDDKILQVTQLNIIETKEKTNKKTNKLQLYKQKINYIYNYKKDLNATSKFAFIVV